jgi:hypothetical protein
MVSPENKVYELILLLLLLLVVVVVVLQPFIGLLPFF